jgi:urea transport system permease protein
MPPANFKLFVFVLCALIASLAGALYVPQVGIINPSEMATDKSLEAVVWVAVGGRGTLIGPIIGAIVRQRPQKLGHARLSRYLAADSGRLFICDGLHAQGIVGLPAQLRSLRAFPPPSRAAPEPAANLPPTGNGKTK